MEEEVPSFDEKPAPSEPKTEAPSKKKPESAPKTEAKDFSSEEKPKLVPTGMNPPKSVSSEDSGKKDDIKIAPVAKTSAKEDSGKKADDSASDPYKPIILVPSDMNPPKSSDTKKDDVVIAPVAKNPPKETAVKKTSADAKPKKLEDLVVKPKSLESGKYYVQIATLSNSEKAQEIIDKYSSRYPVLFVPNSKGSSYQVLVGPLNVDEYGSVLEKFKSYGYKDAYPRKIK